MKPNKTLFSAVAMVALFVGCVVIRESASLGNISNRNRSQAEPTGERADGAIPPPTLPSPRVKLGRLIADGAGSPPKLPGKPAPASV